MRHGLGCLALLLPLAAAADVCTTARPDASSWSDPAAWTNCSGRTPGIGDIAVVTSPLTVDVNTTVGLSLTSGELTGVAVDEAGGGTTDGLLAAGSYRVRVGYVSANGVALVGMEPAFTVAAGHIPRVSFPALPDGATGVTIYLTAPGGASGTETLYDGANCGPASCDLTGAQSAGAPMPVRGAIALSGAGSLTLAPGVTLTVRGDLVGAGSNNLTLSADSALEFDASAAPSPASVHYVFQLGDPSSSPLIRTVGTSAEHPAAIRSNAAGGNAYIATNNPATGIVGGGGVRFDVSYLTFLRMGTASRRNYVGYTPGWNQSFFHVIFDSCGEIYQHGPTPVAGYSYRHVTFRNSPATYEMYVEGASPPKPGMLRELSYDIFDRGPEMFTPSLSVDHCYFAHGWLNKGGGDWAAFTANLIRRTDGGPQTTVGSVLDNYALIDNFGGGAVVDSGTATAASAASFTDGAKSWTPGAFTASTGGFTWAVLITGGRGAGQLRGVRTNTATALSLIRPWAVIPDATSTYQLWRFIYNTHMLLTAGAPGLVVSGNVCDQIGSDEESDCFINSNTPAGIQLTNNIVLPNTGRGQSGTLANYGATAAGQVAAIQHNTYFVASESVWVADYTMVADSVASFKSNLAWFDNPADPGAQPYKIMDARNIQGGGKTQYLLPSNADYNACWNCLEGPYSGNGYDIYTGGAAAGAHDVKLSGAEPSSGPDFVDPTRSFLTWAQSLGSTGTLPEIVADALAQLARQNDFAIDASAAPYTIDSLIYWVKAGFVPRNPALRTAAHDSGTIGALPWRPDARRVRPVLPRSGAVSHRRSPERQPPSPGPAPPPVIRVNAGGAAYADLAGRSWNADSGFSGGASYTGSGDVPGVPAPAYRTQHTGSLPFEYSAALPNGAYIVTLRFAELEDGVDLPGERLFDVSLNGEPVLTHFDIVAQAGGPRRAVDRQFIVTVADGALAIRFTPVRGRAVVNGIEIVPFGASVAVSVAAPAAVVPAGGTARFGASVVHATESDVVWSVSPPVGAIDSTGLYTAPASVFAAEAVTITATSVADPTRFGSATVTVLPRPGFQPIRIHAGGGAYTDSLGRFWAADRGFQDGAPLAASAPLSADDDAALFATQRAGVSSAGFQYEFAVPNGARAVTLVFAEPVYGVGPGHRVFDVSINGSLVLERFDIAADAARPGAPVSKRFTVPVSDGRLRIRLAPVVNAPVIAAIEIQ